MPRPQEAETAEGDSRKHMAAFREKIQYLYSRYDIYILFILKFVLAFVILMEININIGYMETITNILIVAVLSLVCAIIPIAGMVTIGILVIVIHCFALNVIVGAAAACLYIVMAIFVLRFVPKESILMLLLPVGFFCRLSPAVVIGTGLLRTPAAVLSIICSLISWRFLNTVNDLSPLITAGKLTSLELLQQLMQGTFLDSEFIVYAVLFTAIILIMCLMKRIIVNNGYMIAVIFGGVIYYIIRAAGGLFLGIETDYIQELIFTAISVGITALISIFLYDIDYKNGKYVQFEDDDYYYYVRAYPKNVSRRFDEEYREARAESEREEKSRKAESSGISGSRGTISETQVISSKKAAEFKRTGTVSQDTIAYTGTPKSTQVDLGETARIDIPKDEDLHSALEQQLKNLDKNL